MKVFIGQSPISMLHVSPCSIAMMTLESNMNWNGGMMDLLDDHPTIGFPSRCQGYPVTFRPAPPIHRARISPGQSCGRPCRRTRPPSSSNGESCGWNDAFFCVCSHINIGGIIVSWIWGIILWIVSFPVWKRSHTIQEMANTIEVLPIEMSVRIHRIISNNIK